MLAGNNFSDPLSPYHVLINLVGNGHSTLSVLVQHGILVVVFPSRAIYLSNETYCTLCTISYLWLSFYLVVIRHSLSTSFVGIT